MIKCIRNFIASNSKTKWFIFNWAIYGIVMLVTTVYVYARMDYVRTTPLEKTPKVLQDEKKQTK